MRHAHSSLRASSSPDPFVAAIDAQLDAGHRLPVLARVLDLAAEDLNRAPPGRTHCGLRPWQTVPVPRCVELVQACGNSERMSNCYEGGTFMPLRKFN